MTQTAAQAPTDFARNMGEMAWRTVKKFPQRVSHMVPHKGEYRNVTFTEFWEQVFTYAKALHSFGLRRGDRVVILGETCFEWAVTDWAAQTLGLVSVPIYPTLPPDQSQYILEDCGAKVAVCLDAKMASKLTGVPTPLLRPAAGEEGLTDHAGKSDLTREAWEAQISDGSPEDLATFIYTSGTTGQPKGAMLTHGNFTKLAEVVRQDLDVSENDVFFSFLPLSHVFERFAGHALTMSLGATVAYAGSLVSLASDVAKARPTVIVGVPRFLENMRGRIVENVRKQGGIKEKLFDAALAQGLKKYRGEAAPFYGLLDKLVGSKIRERLGGRVRFIASGGAALAPHVSEFYIAFGLNVLQGYGLTETTAASNINRPGQNDPETVGPPFRGIEQMIAPDGEILIRGFSVMKGYYNLPEETKNAIDADGWFHTGDIGEFKNGKLKITDRKKDLLVLGNGKNVAPQPVENRLKESEFIQEAVLLGDGMEYCCALVVPDFERLKGWLSAQGITETDSEKVIQLDVVKAQIKSEIDKINKQLADFEKVKKHVLVGRAFSIDGGELTPSLKVRRKVVKEKYADEIKSMQRV